MMHSRTAVRACLAALAMLFGMAFAPPARGAEAKIVAVGTSANASATVWLETSLHRVYPSTPPGSASLELLAGRNSRLAFQVCIRSGDVQVLDTSVSLVDAADLKPRIRFEELVPVRLFSADMDDVEGVGHIPGLVPDPLLPLTKVNFGPNQTRAYWVTLNVPADAKPGTREINVRVLLKSGAKDAKESTVDLPVKLEISSLVIQPRKDFPVVHWWRGEATWDQYKTGMFDDRWWKLTHDQLADMLDHGSDVVYVPIFFNRRETFKRPCQLLIVKETSPGKYEFDFSRVKKFTDMCKEIGFKQFEWSHLWIYWGVKNPIRVYTEKTPGNFEMLWPPDISGFSDTYVTFLKQFLPALHDFLLKESLLEGSYFHLSDEPNASDIGRYRQARQILHDLAPWMKTMDALSDIDYGKQGVTDMPIPMVSSAQAYIDAKIPHWVYYCCAPTGPWLNRFQDTPLTKIRMSGFVFYRLGAKGFLHWGFNYWHKLEREELADVFNDTTADGTVPAGDPLMIYPGKDAPVDSIRWEVFAESLQDYAILQSAGIKPDDPLLDSIKNYKDFLRAEDWIRETTAAVLKRGSASAASAR